ncbi:hypothetical protein NHX12_028371 [Muraenolepis orangiensis]|uniref:Uncharacterized protein n=1 Tax=Muraenolepis orangiensis TaxID=630683 RepID=A0A9Q0INQ2_9TELE|nr:hypothetical protein NHX12_028371 [Muraenolepis orangiensis]
MSAWPSCCGSPRPELRCFPLSYRYHQRHVAIKTRAPLARAAPHRSPRPAAVQLAGSPRDEPLPWGVQWGVAGISDDGSHVAVKEVALVLHRGPQGVQRRGHRLLGCCGSLLEVSIPSATVLMEGCERPQGIN